MCVNDVTRGSLVNVTKNILFRLHSWLAQVTMRDVINDMKKQTVSWTRAYVRGMHMYASLLSVEEGDQSHM